MIVVRKASTICTLVAALALNNCASISGAITAPVYSASETHKKYQKNLKKSEYHPFMVGIAILSYPIIQAISIGGSVPMGFFDGLAADVYFKKTGRYPPGYRPWKIGSGEDALEKLRDEEEQNERKKL